MKAVSNGAHVQYSVERLFQVPRQLALCNKSFATNQTSTMRIIEEGSQEDRQAESLLVQLQHVRAGTTLPSR
jgi:hypothetical protein